MLNNDFEIKDGVLVKYHGTAAEVVIPSEVHKIGKEAFAKNGTLVSVRIPDSVTAIGDYAFYECETLCAVEVLGVPEMIGSHAFGHCPSLRRVKIPPMNKIRLKGMNIFIGSSHPQCYFTYCIYPEDKMRGALEWLAGDTCEWDDVAAITDYLKRKKYEVLLEIAKSGTKAMATDLIDLIGRSKFTIDEVDAAVAAADAAGNTSVKATILSYKQKTYSSVQVADNSVIRADKKQGLAPMTVKEASRLYQIIGNATTGYTLKKYLGDEAQVVVPSVIGTGKVVSLDGTFYCCKHVTSVTIPDTVTEFSGSAFSESGLTSVVIPPSIKKIGPNTFAGCKSLASVRIDAKVSTLGVGAFKNCTALTSITIPPSVKKIVKECFSGCTSLSAITLHDKITDIGEEAFSRSGLKSITIPSAVEQTGLKAFKSCKSLMSVTISDGVKEISGGCFWGCEQLSAVSIPASVKVIGRLSFSSCHALKSLEIPLGAGIARDAFLDCPINKRC